MAPNDTDRIHDRIDALDTKIMRKLDELGKGVQVFDTRLSLVEDRQTRCLSEHAADSSARKTALLRIIAGVAVGVVLSILGAAAAYAAMTGRADP